MNAQTYLALPPPARRTSPGRVRQWRCGDIYVTAPLAARSTRKPRHFYARMRTGQAGFTDITAPNEPTQSYGLIFATRANEPQGVPATALACFNPPSRVGRGG